MRHDVADKLPSPDFHHLDGTSGWTSGGTPEPSSLTVRLRTDVDTDALREHLARLWCEQGGRRRARSGVELSVVETCGRSPGERERDALRLLGLEAASRRDAASGVPLRATLVSVDARDHLLLLAAPAEGGGAMLRPILAGLRERYALDTLGAP
jgi:hypothetical protein